MTMPKDSNFVYIYNINTSRYRYGSVTSYNLTFLHIYHFQNQKQTRIKWRKRDMFMTSIIQVIIMDGLVTCEYKSCEDVDGGGDNDAGIFPVLAHYLIWWKKALNDYLPQY